MSSSHWSPGPPRGEPAGVCEKKSEERQVLGSSPMVCTIPLLAQDRALLPADGRTSHSTSSASVQVLLKERDHLLLSFGYLHLKDFFLKKHGKPTNLYTQNKKIPHTAPLCETRHVARSFGFPSKTPDLKFCFLRHAYI